MLNVPYINIIYRAIYLFIQDFFFHLIDVDNKIAENQASTQPCYLLNK